MMEHREQMHEREVMQARIAELEAALRDAEQVGTERMERIRALADSVDELESQLGAEKRSADAALASMNRQAEEQAGRLAEQETNVRRLADRVAGLEQEATRLADELACERERHQATLVVGLGLSDELRQWVAEGERRWDAGMELQAERDVALSKVAQLRATNAGLSQRLAVLSMMEVERAQLPIAHVPSVIDTTT